MNFLESYFQKNTGRFTLKWKHYLEIYDRHFSRYRGQPVTVLEIGVYAGGSLQMWKSYFGPQATIYGVDLNPKTREYEEEQISIIIGNQSNRGFLRELKNKLKKVDILIDDGGHRMRQQGTTFDELFTLVADDGVYVCEDLHTSYWHEFGGGYRRNGTFVERSKGLVDAINGWFSQGKGFGVSEFTLSIGGIHFYPSIVVIEKRAMAQPEEIFCGNNTMPKRAVQRMPIMLRLIRGGFRMVEFVSRKLRLKSVLY